MSKRAETRPSTRQAPRVGRYTPPKTRKSVLLPAPLWPMTPSRSPSRTSKETSRSACSSRRAACARQPPSRRSFSVARPPVRTRYVRLSLSTSIRVILELENQLALTAGDNKGGHACRRRRPTRQQQPLPGSHVRGAERRRPQQRLAQELRQGCERVVIQDPPQPAL